MKIITKKRLLISLVLIPLITLLGISGYVYTVLRDIPLEKLTPVDNNKDVATKFLEIEEGSGLDLSELEHFYLFSPNELNFTDFIKEKLQEQKLQLVTKGKESIIVLKNFPISESYKNDCELIYCLQKRSSFAKIPAIFWRALIGIEDLRFTDHMGIDFKSLARALWVDLLHMKFVQGGSTLTQQLVKNIYFSNERSLLRKINEMIVALYIEYKYDKEKIIESYLNEFIWGSLQGVKIKGLYSASIFYFQKRPEELGHFEAAILISLLKGPYFYHPINQLNRLQDRAKLVYEKLTELKLFPLDENEIWQKKDWEVWQKKLISINKKNFLKNLWMSNKNDSSYLNQYEKYVFYNKAEETLAFAKDQAKEQNIAIKAYVGSINSEERFYYYSKYERDSKDALFKEKHQIGSTIKPIVYSFFIEDGASFDDFVSTDEISLKLKSGVWKPGESHKIKEKEVTLRDALFDSLNRPVISLTQKYGFEAIEPRLQAYFPDLLLPLKEFPAQLLGSIEVAVVDLFEVYHKFLKKECSDIPNEKESVLAQLSDPSKTTVRHLVGEQMGKLRFFGKTGTTNNGYDNWFVSFDGRELSVIWVGYEGIRDKGNFKLYGSNTSFKLFKNFSVDRGRQFNELNCAWQNDSI
jgi:penicillin-binding protein 1B